MRLLVYVSTALLFSQTVLAGELIPTPQTLPASSQQNEILTRIESSVQHPLMLENSGNVWDFAMIDDSTLFGEANVLIGNLPSGYNSNTVKVRVPFFAKSSMPIFPYAISSDVGYGRKEAELLLADAADRSGISVQTKFNIYFRAKHIAMSRIRSLATSGSSPSRLDLNVIYLYIFSARELYEDRYVWPDEDTIKAVDWLSGQVKTRPGIIRRVLGVDGNTSKGNAEILVSRLRALEATFLQKIYQSISKEEVQAQRCKLYVQLQSYLRSMTPDKVRFFERNANRLLSQTATAVATCKARAAETAIEQIGVIEVAEAKKALIEVEEQTRVLNEVNKRIVRNESALRLRELRDIEKRMKSVFKF